MSAATGFLDRYAAVPDLRGPRIRLGILWTLSLVAALLVAGEWGLALHLGATAGVAGLQVSGRWHEAGVAANQVLAGVGPVVVALAAAVNNTVLGLAVVLFVLVALAFPVSFHDVPSTDPRAAAGLVWGTVAAGLLPAVAAAAAVQVMRVDGMAFLFLLAATCTYDAGDFLCYGGPRQRLVGPVAGMLGVLVVTVAMFFAKPPPFDATGALWMGLALALLCPAGQLLASWLLPRPRARVPALRRLDSWLLSAPVMLAAAWIAQR